MLFALDASQTTEAWKTFINFGVIGVIAFVTLSFAAAVVWTVWVLFRRWLVQYVPDLFHEAVVTLRSVRTSQEGIATTQATQAATAAKLVELHDKLGATVSEARACGLRNEEFLALSLDALEDFVRQSQDPTLKVDWSRHINAMRNSLSRSTNRA